MVSSPGHLAKSRYLVQTIWLQSLCSEHALPPPSQFWKKVNESLLREYFILSPAASHSHMTSHLDFLTIMWHRSPISSTVMETLAHRDEISRQADEALGSPA